MGPYLAHSCSVTGPEWSLTRVSACKKTPLKSATDRRYSAPNWTQNSRWQPQNLGTALTTPFQVYNQFFEGKSGEVRSREVNGRLILEGSLRIYWGVQGVIHLKENDDQRTVVTVRKRNSYRLSASTDNDSDDDVQSISRDTSYNDISTCSDITTSLEISELSKSDTGIESGLDSTDVSTAENSPNTPPLEMLPKSVTLPSKLDVKNLEWDELDELLQVERKFDESEKLYQTMPVPLPSQSSTETSSSTQSNDSSTKTERWVF